MSKLLTVFFVCFSTITYLDCDNFLGKNINNIPYSLTVFDAKSNTYSLSNQKINFLSKSVDLMIVSADKDNIIHTISTEFKEIFNKGFYDELILKYGEPSHILKHSKSVNEKIETFEKKEFVKSSESQLVECKFEDKPMFIIWNKANKKITIMMQHPLNSTFVLIQKI